MALNYEKHSHRLLHKYPRIEDLQKRALQRIPFVASEYMETGTGDEIALRKNISSFEQIKYLPQFMKGSISPQIETELFGKTYSAPFGIAPIGLSGLMWPELEIILAKTGNRRNIPYNLSTVAAETPERLGEHIGDNGWFQLYTPSSKSQRERLLTRAKESGFKVLVVTCDIPIPSRRERTKRAGLQTPPKITPRFIWQGLTHPAWTIATLKRGMPRLRTIEDTPDFKKMMSVEKFVPNQVSSNLSWETFKEIRDFWDGPLVLKGVMHPDDADKAIAIGADGIQVSNHGARQFDAAPAAIDVLPLLAERINGRVKVLFDSGIRSGLDIMKAVNLGADFVFCGRAFLYGVCALDKLGGEHVYEILNGGLQNSMIQMGVKNLNEVRAMKVFGARK